MADSSTMLSKTASAPSLVKERRSATQALLRATAAGDTRAMRTLALRCGAELAGSRAYNNEGNAPFELLAKCEHMTPSQKSLVKKQLIELPRLIDTHLQARTGVVTGAVTRGIDPNASLAMTSPGNAGKQTLRERDLSMKFAMATLGESVGNADATYEAVLNKPRLLKAPPDAASRALKALCTTLRDESLAVRTIKKNAILLEYEASKFQALIPVLLGILGAEETAYALATRPELLDVDRPQLIRDTVQSIADSIGSYVDAMWLICQTLTPPSIKVMTHAWVHEELGGTFLRLRGVRVHNRPVYKKTAASLAHHGARARDMYIVFQEGSTSSGDRWLFTPSFDEKKLRVAANSELAQVATPRTSPDQAIAVWSVLSCGAVPGEEPEWRPDPYFLVQDARAPRGRGLLTVTVPDVRNNYNFLKEAVGPFWLEGVNGCAAEGTRFVGNLKRSDPLHLESAIGKFKSFGDFAPSQGFGYIQTTLAARQQQALVLQAWEPLSVYLLFHEEEEAPADPYLHKLALCGWLPVGDPHTWRLPELSGVPAITKVLVCGFLRGRVEIPTFEGSGNLPLIFVKTTVVADSGHPAWSCGAGSPCQPYVVARPGEALHSIPEPAEAGVVEDAPEPHKLEKTGEVGYAAGYSLIRPNLPEGPCDPSQTQILIDTEQPIRVVICWFYPPDAAASDAAPVSPQGKKPAAKASSPVGSNTSKAIDNGEPVIPPPPPWVAADRWKKKEVAQPVAIKTCRGEIVTASHIFTKDFECGEIPIRGSNDATTAVLWLALKDRRPHPLQQLLLRRPSVLASGSIFALLLRRLRTELGIAIARKVIAEKSNDWSAVCEAGGYDEVDAWVAERKMEAFGDQLRGIHKARSLVEREHSLLGVTAPELTECCAVLEDGLGGRRAMLEAVSSLPELLAADARALRRSVDVLRSIFNTEPTYRIGARLPRLFLCSEKLEVFFARLKAEFPKVAEERLQQRTSGEWVRWPDFTDQSGEVLATWLGRIAAEERNLSCQDRVHLSGMHGKVRAA